MYGKINFTPTSWNKTHKITDWEKEKEIGGTEKAQDCLAESGEYAIDPTLSNNGKVEEAIAVKKEWRSLWSCLDFFAISKMQNR